MREGKVIKGSLQNKPTPAGNFHILNEAVLNIGHSLHPWGMGNSQDNLNRIFP